MCLHHWLLFARWHGDGASNIVENLGIFCRQQGHAGCKTLLQQNPPVLNQRCLLTQVLLCNGCKTVIVVVVVVVVVVVADGGGDISSSCCLLNSPVLSGNKQ